MELQLAQHGGHDWLEDRAVGGREAVQEEMREAAILVTLTSPLVLCLDSQACLLHICPSFP